MSYGYGNTSLHNLRFLCLSSIDLYSSSEVSLVATGDLYGSYWPDGNDTIFGSTGTAGRRLGNWFSFEANGTDRSTKSKLNIVLNGKKKHGWYIKHFKIICVVGVTQKLGNKHEYSFLDNYR